MNENLHEMKRNKVREEMKCFSPKETRKRDGEKVNFNLLKNT